MTAFDQSTESYTDHSETRKRVEYIQALYALADFLAANPNAPIPTYHDMDIYTYELSEVRAATHLSGKWDKQYCGSYAIYRKTFGNPDGIPIHYQINLTRTAVCERIQVGTREVEAQPAREAYTEPVYDWVCSGADSEPPEPPYIPEAHP